MKDTLLPQEEVAIKAALGADVHTDFHLVREPEDCIVAIDVKPYPDPNTPEIIPIHYYGAPLQAFPSIGFAACWINTTIYYRELREHEKGLPESTVVIRGYQEWMAKMGLWFRGLIEAVDSAPHEGRAITKVILPEGPVRAALESTGAGNRMPTTFLGVPIEYAERVDAVALFTDGQTLSIYPD